MAPFDNVKVRQAIAAALPYDDMFKAALFGRGAQAVRRRLDRARRDTGFPQPMPLPTDLARAKQLLAEAGHAERLQHHLRLQPGQSATAEPMAALVKESLGKVGIQVDIQKKPDAEFNTLEAEKKCRSTPTARRPGCRTPTTSSTCTSPATSAGTSPPGRTRRWSS